MAIALILTGWWTGLGPFYQQAIITAGMVVGSLLAAHVLKAIWDHVFIPLARRTPTKLDVLVLEQTSVPVYLLIIIVGLYFSFLRLMEAYYSAEGWTGEQVEKFKDSLLYKSIDGLLYSVAVLLVAYAVFAAVRAVTTWYMQEIAVRTQTRLDDQLVPLSGRVAKIVIYFIAVTVILNHFNQPITALLGAAGIASLAVAFAAQETLANIISGLALMFDRPFRIGDRIQLPDGQMGNVYEIGLRSTRILSLDNTLIVVPNSEIAKAKLVNFAYPDLRFTIRQQIGVAYGSDIEKVKRVLLEIAHAHPEVLKDPAPGAFFYEFGDSALIVFFIVWVADYREQFRIRDELNCEIKRRFEQEGVEIPFPQRTVHIRRD